MNNIYLNTRPERPFHCMFSRDDKWYCAAIPTAHGVEMVLGRAGEPYPVSTASVGETWKDAFMSLVVLLAEAHANISRDDMVEKLRGIFGGTAVTDKYKVAKATQSLLKAAENTLSDADNYEYVYAMFDTDEVLHALRMVDDTHQMLMLIHMYAEYRKGEQ